jgi:hypothetical protein
MKAWDYDAVVYAGETYCVGCLPDGVGETDPDVDPIFATSEVDGYPVCCNCGHTHDYMCLTGRGRAELNKNQTQEADDEADS